LQDDTEEYTYRAYVTEALRLQGEDKYPSARWLDLIDQTEPEVDNRSCGEIAHDIFARIRGEKN
jgi:hypothetical protein